MILHSVSFYPFQWMSFGFLQTILGGAVFHPAHLIPFQHTFFTQQLYGDFDSSFLGLYTQLSLPQSFRIKLVFYVDDWDAFSSASKQEGTGFNLNSAQNKFALQVGLSWSPTPIG